MWFVVPKFGNQKMDGKQCQRNETSKQFYLLQLQLLSFFLFSVKVLWHEIMFVALGAIFDSWQHNFLCRKTYRQHCELSRTWKSGKRYTKRPFIEDLILFVSAFTRCPFAFNSFFHHLVVVCILFFRVMLVFWDFSFRPFILKSNFL